MKANEPTEIIQNIVDHCADLGAYDDDDFTSPEALDNLEGEQEECFYEWLESVLRHCARTAIDMYVDETGGDHHDA